MFLTISSAMTQEPATWPQWRGPTRDGMASGNFTWPDTLQGNVLEKLWRVELGPSYSGPIIAGEKVFITETLNKKTETTRALDRKTGKILWSREWAGAMTVPFFARANGDWIRSTPTLDGDSLYVAGMRDVLVCLDVNTGSERWRVDFVKELNTPLPDFGFVCSPLVVGDHVYVQAGGGFVKLEKKTGKILWRTLQDGGGMMGSAFSSPIFCTLNQKPQLLVQTRTKLASVEPETGKVNWSQEIPAFRGMNILPPTLVGDAIFTASHSGGAFLFRAAASNNAVQEVWKKRYEGYMSSPIVIGDYAYLHMKNQRFSCIDIKTGNPTWTTTKTFGKYWSMVAAKDKMLALDERGDLLLIKANPEKFELLDTRKVSEQECWAHLAVCGDEIYIRDLQGITAYRWKSPTAAASK
ncbi:MAG: PQQ-binding-like beta-propeller repeat protein [Planctomycetia bacterium]|nr:PQQ-binding-like beta-propeller repeat protein [Planctomycetia bacterium]